MGFKCPNCNKDFGYDEDKLKQHLRENGSCGAVAYLAMMTVAVLSGKKKGEKYKLPKVRRKYESIDPNHNFVKRNIVTGDDMWDEIECSKCGLKGKRNFSQYKFDGRISYKRIEKCGE